MLIRTTILAAGMAALFAGAALAQSSNGNPPPAPPPPAAQAQNNATDMSCRRQAASQSGYRSSDSTDSDAAHNYADAYYACMDQAYGYPGRPDTYASLPPPPNPYYYSPYPYPYYYPPYYYGPGYYGPGVSLGFRFGGGFHGGRRR
jgi:hypothetical protein